MVSGRALPADLPVTPGRIASGVSAVIREEEEDAFVSVAWGMSAALYLLTRHGLLCSVDVEDRADDLSTDLGRRAFAVIWAERLCGERPGQGGLLACAMEHGLVQILDAEHLRSIAMLRSNFIPGSLEAVGVSYSIGGEAVWVLYSDRSLARWRRLEGEPDRMLPAPMEGLQDAACVPGGCLPQLVTSSEAGLQLWAAVPGEELRLDAQELSKLEVGPGDSAEAKGAATGVTALACSPWLVACGHKTGELRLAGLPRFEPAEMLPFRHSSDVLALSFSSWRPASGAPLLFASASMDRSIAVFRVDLETVGASLMLHLQGHSAPVQSVALLGSPGLSGAHAAEGTLHLAACLGDRSLCVRELELGNGGASVRRVARQPSRGGEWVGLCAHPVKAAIYAACTERRVIQLDAGGRASQQLRVGGAESELRAPLRLSSDGRLLAVGLTAVPRANSTGPTAGHSPLSQGVLLLEADPSLRPLSCLVGHSGPARSLAFLQGDRVAGWWKDGVMMLWDAGPPQSTALGAAEPRRGEDCAARGASPPNVRRGRPCNGLTSPVRNDRPGRTGCGGSSQRGRGAASSSSPRRARMGGAPASAQTARLRTQRSSRNELPTHPECPGRGPRASRAEPQRSPDGILKKLLANSPRPPKWAGSSMDSSLGSGVLSASLTAECSSLAGRRHGTLLLGKWARGSRVGEQVLSASDLHAALASEEMPIGGLAWAEASHAPAPHVPSTSSSVPGEASRGPRAASRSLSRSRDGTLVQPLPPKPCFPPPLPLEPGVQHSASSILQSEAPLSTRILELPPGSSVLGVATPCRALATLGGSPDDAGGLSVTQHAAALAAELRTRAAGPVLEELALALLAESRRELLQAKEAGKVLHVPEVAKSDPSLVSTCELPCPG